MTGNTVALSREIPVHDGWDVVVVGGGPAGCAAAASAAREGAKTLLIEATGSLGGMGTGGLISAWCPFTDGKQVIYKGLAEKVFTEARRGMPHVGLKWNDWVPIDPELLKRVYDDLVTESGATILFNTVLSAVQTDGEGRVKEIIVSNKGGLSAYRAKVFVDCTGDGDLAAWAGAEYEIGEDGEGLMPSSHCFILSNVDDYGYRYGELLHGANSNSPIYEILRSGEFPQIPDWHVCNVLIGPGTVGFNAGHLFDLDGTNPVALSQAFITGRKIAKSFRDALAKHHPAFANSFLVTTGSLMGVRESRRIIGDYVLTADDYLHRSTFPDEICRNSYTLDVHPKRVDDAQSPADHEKFVEALKPYSSGESHGIPYRCLTPRGLANVLVAGRSISCDQMAQSSIRVMPVCLAMGEAAGMAAAHAVADDFNDVHAVDTDRLRKRLREEGAYLPLPEAITEDPICR